MERLIVGRAGTVILLLAFVVGNCLGQSILNTKFERITSVDGLSHNQVHSIFQDQDGYIWIGTLSGLNRYDGYEIKVYKHDEEDTTSLPNNTIQWITQGPEGMIWVKYTDGISAYNPLTDAFGSPDKYFSLLQTSGAFIEEMLVDTNGDFWFSIENRGLVKLYNGNKILQLNKDEGSDVAIATNNVADLVEDQSGKIWIVHSRGIVECIDPFTNTVMVRYGMPGNLSGGSGKWGLYVDSDGDFWIYSYGNPFGVYYLNTTSGSQRILDGSVLTNNMVTDIVEGEDGNVWLGIDHGGISVVDKQTWSVKAILHDPNIPKSLGHNNVGRLFKDRSGGIWVGTIKNGVSYHHHGANNFSHYKLSNNIPAFNDMSSFAEDEKGNLWIGTNGKGVLYFDRSSNTFSELMGEVPFSGSKPEIIVSLLYSSDKTLWIGTFLEGLYRYDGKALSKFDFEPSDRVQDISVWDLFEDSKGNIWIGTLSNGVYKYDITAQSTINYNEDDMLSSNFVTCIEEDNAGNIWIGTASGLSVFDPVSEIFKSYISSDQNGQNSLSNSSIVSLYCDSKDRIWIATLDGLNLYRKNTDGFLVLKEKDGLSSNLIMSVQEDDHGDFWLSTSKGITKMKYRNGEFEFQTFDLFDGLQSEAFTEDAGLKTSDGMIIFSGQNGFNMFNPEDVKINNKSSNLMLTNFYLSNNRISPGIEYNKRIILDKLINDTKSIHLNYNENSFSFEFITLSFFQSKKIRYQYKLEGFDTEWIDAFIGSRKATYTNLDYGEYTFSVRSSNNHNAWSEPPRSVNIYIKPPIWKTSWAYALYAILIILALYITRFNIIKRERKKAGIENERREAERQHQLDLMKIKFFTNISHEFRTPLSLVLTPIERMIKNPKKIKESELTIVQRNAKRLMTLVNQLLDFRKMEANQHKLSQSNGNIVAFLQDVTDSFSDLSKEKEIELNFKTDVKSYYTYFDKDKMEKIMFNLISNAFKFTLPGGRITVGFEINPERNKPRTVLITVNDTGIGIAKEKQILIFNRFFQNDISGDFINNGTGIGLSITKEFVELHGGEITVDSTPDMGSTFVVELPLKEVISEEDHAEELMRGLAESMKQSKDSGPLPEKGMPSVLLVEDNLDFRFYLKDNLKQFYHVNVASNGKEAWKIILTDLPDVVISDVMMPIMDGHELCEKIKSDPRTMHTPVILLTAHTSDQHRIEGLEAGAIEYISKPFNFEILISSINSALKFQQRVQKAGSMIKAEPSDISVVSRDEKLIAKAVELIEANISNPEFSVEDMGHELGYSRGHLYIKILNITGQTPIDFIRNIKMKRATILLKEGQMNVSEVAYQVGYNSPRQFSRYFKLRYNMYPSEYKSDEEAE